MRLIEEIQRRNILRAGVAYTVVFWLLVQVFDLMLDAFEAPGWILRTIIILLAVGFPIAMILAWFFELTPKGLVRNEDLPPDYAQNQTIRPYLNGIVISMLCAAVLLFALDRFVWTDKTFLEIPTANPTANVNAGADNNSLAVLPFINRSNQAEDVYFVDGIHDDLLTLLTKIDSFRLVSRTTIMLYRDSDKSIPEIGAELKVGYVLEGAVQRAGKNIRVTAQLIDAGKDEHLWAETFDRELTTESLFAIQSEIARAIATALDAELSNADESRLDEVPTESLAAYDVYLKGRQSLLGRNTAALEEATRHFKNSILLDDTFAGAYAGLCETQLRQYFMTSDSRQYELAETTCQQALDISPDQTEVHIALGKLFRNHGDYPLAESEQRKALGVESNNVEAMIELGLVLAYQGEIQEARTVLHRAETLQPNHWPTLETLFSYYRNYDDQEDRYERAAKYAMRVVELIPEQASAWNNLGTAYFSLQQYDAAKVAWDRGLEIEPTRTAYTNRGLQYFYDGEFAASAQMQLKATELAPNDHRAWGRLADSYRLMDGEEARSSEAFATAIGLAESKLEINDQDWRTGGLLATYYVHTGQTKKALELVDSQLAISGSDPDALFIAAQVWHQLGDEVATLLALEGVLERDSTFRYYIATDPDFKSLRGNPRYDVLVEPLDALLD